MNKFLYILVLSAILNAACRQTETATNAPPMKTDETKTTAIRVSEASVDAAEPAIAADADGNFYVLYVEHGAEKNADVYLQKFDAQMKSSGEKTRVNREAGEAAAWRGDPPTVKVGADKTVYVGWTRSVKTATGNGRDVCLSVSNDGGKSFAAPVKVNDDSAPASHGMHSLAVGRDGVIFMAWLDERNVKIEHHAQNYRANSAGDEFQFVKAHHHSNENQSAEPKKDEKHEAAEPNSEIFFAASNDGGKTFAANVKLSSEVCPCCKTALAIAPDGRVYASWRQVLPGDYRHIAVASSVDAGKTFSAPAIVSDDRWKINACPVSGAALIVDRNNALKVVWFTAGDAGKIGLYEAESRDSGATFAARRLISAGEVFGTAAVSGADDGDFKVLWESEGGIYAAKTANGVFEPARLIFAGNLPSAVAVGAKFGGAFIKKEPDKRAVWLAEF